MSTANPKAQEPSMDDILASIRRIISDDYGGGLPKPAAGPAEPAHEAEALSYEPAPVMVESETLDPAGDPALAPADEGPVASGIDLAPSEPDEPPVRPLATAENVTTELETGYAPPAGLSEPPSLPPRPEPVPSRIASEPKSPSANPRELSPTPSAAASARPAPIAPPTAPPMPRTPEPILSNATIASVGESFHALSSTMLTGNNARTLEDIVKDMLRPMLQVWLDDNLPPLVERLVRAEIERVARGRP